MSRMSAPSKHQTTVIEPRPGWLRLELGELWSYRELAYFLVWRDLKVRYKQTIIGGAWAVVQPLVLMVIFSLVFGRVRGLRPPADFPAPIYYFSALLPWTYFSQALQVSTGSVLNQSQVIKKVYFPRIMLPLAAVLPGLVEFMMSFLVLIFLMIGFGIPFTWRLVALPPLLLLTSVTAFAAGTWLSAMNALYRDVREAIVFLVQVLFFTSPVILPARLVPDWFRPFYALNPVTGIIEGFRWAITGLGQFPWDVLPAGIVVAVVMLIGGVIYFRRIEDVIVDVA